MNSKMNSILSMYAIAASMAGDSMYGSSAGEAKVPTDKQLEQLLEKRKRQERQRMLERGAKEYWYGEEVIYARSQKNADKKARKRGLIK